MMNIFLNTRREYGQNTVRRIRELESYEKKIAQHRNHLVFSLRCRDENVITPSLKLSCGIKIQKARDIIKKAEKALIRERMRLINNNLGGLENQKVRITREINEQLPTHVFSHITRVRENEFESSKWRQVNKLKRLTAKTALYDDNNIDLTGTKLKKWVVNISNYKLNDDQTRVLRKELNYAETPDKLPVEDVVVATEQACRSLPIDKADQLRAQVADVMKSAKLPTPNITKKERQALVELRKEKSIMIPPADKGKATVIMDTGEHEQKVITMLSDDKTYEKLNKDPTPKSQRKLVFIIKRLKEEDNITDEQYKYL